jgi:hypothetical protein
VTVYRVRVDIEATVTVDAADADDACNQAAAGSWDSMEITDTLPLDAAPLHGEGDTNGRH